METMPLRHLAEVRVSNVDKKSVDTEIPVRLCNYTDVYYQDVIDPETDFMAATATREQIRAFSLRAGDILFTKDSETPDDIAVPAFVAADLPRVVSGYHLALVRADANRIDPKFLFRVMQSDYMREQFAVAASGVTRYGLTYGAIRGAGVPRAVTNVDEQRRISDFLDDQVSRIDQAVRLREAQVELLLIRQRSMVERFLGAVGPGSPTVRLQRLMHESDERIGSAVDATELLSVSIHHGVRRRSDHTGDPARSDDLQKYKVVRANDLVLNRMRAFQGGLGIAPIKGIVSPDYAVIRVGAQVDPWFLHHLTRSSWFIGEMTARLRGIGSVDQGNVRTPRINVEDFLRIEIPTIGMAEQRSASGAFQAAEEDVRRQVSLFESHVALLCERRRALITAAVTGEFDVTTASGRGVA